MKKYHYVFNFLIIPPLQVYKITRTVSEQALTATQASRDREPDSKTLQEVAHTVCEFTLVCLATLTLTFPIGSTFTV